MILLHDNDKIDNDNQFNINAPKKVVFFFITQFMIIRQYLTNVPIQCIYYLIRKQYAFKIQIPKRSRSSRI